VKPFDRARLPDVEGLAGRDGAVFVEQHHSRNTLTSCKRVRDGTGKLTSTNDTDGRHDPVKYCSELTELPTSNAQLPRKFT
jgi:hypothetical protein